MILQFLTFRIKSFRSNNDQTVTYPVILIPRFKLHSISIYFFLQFTTRNSSQCSECLCLSMCCKYTNKKLFHILRSTEMTAEDAKGWLALHCSWWVGAGAVLHTKLYHLQSHGGLIICRLHTWAGMSGAQFAELTQACKFAYIPVLSEAVQIYM